MEWLRNYILTVAALGIVSAVADVLMPEGNVRRFARFAISLLLTLALCAPVVSLLQNGSLEGFAALESAEIPQTDTLSAGDEIKKNIDGMIQKYSGFEAATCDVTIDEDLRVEQVTIYKNLGEEGIVDSLLHEKSEKSIKLLISAVYGLAQENIFIEE